MENETKVDEVASLEMSELGVSSEIELVRLARLGFSTEGTTSLALSH